MTASSAIMLTRVQRSVQTDGNHLDFHPHKPHHRNSSSIRDQVRVLAQDLLILSRSAVKGSCQRGSSETQSSLPVVQSVHLSPQSSQLMTKQSQFIKSLLVCLIFYTHDYSHCFPQPYSSLSRPFLKCYLQNCTELFSLTIAEQSTEITSFALQAELLFIHPSTALASFSTTNNHVELVVFFYPAQSFSAEL